MTYKKLVIVGNGFDRNLKLPTLYSDFKEYLKRNTTLDDEGVLFEFIYSNLLDESIQNEDMFWSCFEENLSSIDVDRFTTIWGNSYEDAEDVFQYLNELKEYIYTNFHKWIKTINDNILENAQVIKCLTEDCLFINFNYTNTLECYYGVRESDIIYIHNCIKCDKEIIMGHSKSEELSYLKEGFMDIPYSRIQKHLFGYFKKTDKNVEENIRRLKNALNGCFEQIVSAIDEVYVLGHSMADVDAEYFRY